jgi:predicted HD superfamily hydrolase involved in NAD metabolism
MNRDELRGIVKEQMPAKRWEHTLGVIETSLHLAKQYGANSDKAELAAIVHDYAKYWPVEALQEIIKKEGLPEELLHYDKQLWHAPVGAFVVQRDLNINDEEVLNAVRYHTSGRKDMTLLEKVVCLADYIEPGRDYPAVEKMRELAKVSIEKALIAGFDSTINFLIQKGKRIFPLTIIARNDLIQKYK